MDNYKNPKNKGLVKGDDYHFVHLNNPSCGDDMNVELKVVGVTFKNDDGSSRADKIIEIATNGKENCRIV